MAIINTDIYNISQLVEDVKKEQIPDETEQTLALGTYGYIGAIESKKLQRAIMMTGELANETFPTRAKLERNVITHSIIYGIEDINARPAKMQVIFGITQDDLEANIKNDTFIIDRECPIYIDSFEYHLEYNIIVSKSVVSGNNIVYTARYDITRNNPSSDIINPYLSSPAMLFFDNKAYIIFSCIISQVYHDVQYKKLVTSDIIDNKTFNFNFEHQLAYFEILVSENNTETYLTPIFEGAAIPEGTNYYCYYTYIDSETIRVKFDRNSYMPGLNANINILIKTTDGKSGNFKYKKNYLYINLESSNYGYKNINMLLRSQSDSENGRDRKSKEELQSLLPKEILAKGSITTITDLNNYFNMINTNENRIVVQKKIDNQFERTFYAYLVLKDQNDDIIPTNTIDMMIDINQFNQNENNRYVLKSGACILLRNGIGYVIDPDDYVSSDGDFVYTNPYTIVINRYKLYSAFYMMIMNMDPYLYFTYINQNAKVQFISETVHWERNFLTNTDRYLLEIDLEQNINKDMDMVIIETDEDGNVTVIENNMKVIALFYRDGAAYRYKELELTSLETDAYSFSWSTELISSDALDEDNNIRIENVGIVGSTVHDYGYFNPNTDVEIYVLAKFDEEYGRNYLDKYVPGLDGYTVCNMYTVADGLDFFYNYSEIMGSRVTAIGKTENETTITTGFKIASVPVFGYQYCRDESYVADAINQLNYRKAYIDNAITVLEQSFSIDFKLFNTYGPSNVFTIDGTTRLNRTNIKLAFRTKLVSASDSYTREYIIRDVKEYIEDLNDIGSIHIPNLITQITNTYKESITYFEFVGINEYGPGIQHLYKDDDSTIGIHVVPEFICVNNIKDSEGKYIPEIDVEIVV